LESETKRDEARRSDENSEKNQETWNFKRKNQVQILFDTVQQAVSNDLFPAIPYSRSARRLRHYQDAALLMTLNLSFSLE
jgi:hypothetical protein